MKKLLCLLILLSLPSQSFAQIHIAQKHRVANFGPGFCMWTSIEMCGRHQGIKKLYNLAANRAKLPEYVWIEYGDGYLYKEIRNVGTDWGSYRAMEKLGVKFTQQWSGNYDDKLIRYAMKKKIPIAFSVRDNALFSGSTSHALVLTYYDDKIVQYVDTNWIQDDYYYEATRGWFDHFWHGWLMLVEKE
jgi:hypothetical protein